ncbi:MAG: hypothetical protein WB565_00190 [Acidimicrobiales bacterium]
MRERVQTSGVFDDDHSLGIVLAALDVGAMNLIYLSLDPIPLPDGTRFDSKCQLDPESATAGVLIFAWYTLVGLHMGSPIATIFTSDDFCRATQADDELHGGFQEMEIAWHEMATDETRSVFAVADVLLRLYRERVQRRGAGGWDMREEVAFWTMMQGMERVCGTDYFLAMVNADHMDVIRAKLDVFDQFMQWRMSEESQ